MALNSDGIIALAEELNAFATEQDDFIKAMDLQPGDVLVSTDLIYWAYIKWKHSKGEQKIMHRRNFFHGFKDKFKHKTVKSKAHYFLLDERFNIGNDEKKIMLEFYKEINAEARKNYKWRKRSQAARKKYIESIKDQIPEIKLQKRRLKDRLKIIRRSVAFQSLRLNDLLLTVQNQLEKSEREIQKGLRALRKASSQE